MRQHNRKLEGSVKRKRQWIWTRGKEILAEMNLPSPITKKDRRKAFAEARKQARKEYK